MINVVKPIKTPKRLTAGLAEIAKLETTLTASPATAGSATSPFSFQKGIYGAKAVKTALSDAQHSKCCFCEGIFNAQYAGDVEHFRPKTYVHQDRKSPKHYPGYYWLAYQWANLYYSCSKCNTSKGNQFPLANEAARARRPSDDITLEQPLLLDPGGAANPRHHISFVDSLAKGLTPEGLATIDVADLNRLGLQTDRNKTLRIARYLRDIATLPDSEMTSQDLITVRTQARDQLVSMTSPASPYSAMIQDNV